ncbi:MAG TPA: sigma-54 dependent transcriptional regulator [Bacteroidales bacterium]|nr:sigma-54 dependent transcriptional regulator [Bacteroidales bacterium]
MDPLRTLPSPVKVLIIDDDADILLSLRLALKARFQSIRTESDPERIREIVQDDPFDVVLLDMNFQSGDTSGSDGLYWLRKIRFLKPDAAVIMMTAYAGIGLAVQAMKEGAVDFVTKPWDAQCLIESVELASRMVLARREHRHARHSNGAAFPAVEAGSPEFVGISSGMKGVFRSMGRVGPTEASVLIIGEDGSGKELVAREMHRLSRRTQGPFVSIDLNAVPENMMAVELFGSERGPYAGGLEERQGKLELARGGTLFLNGLGCLNLEMQHSLVNAIRDRQFHRAGNTQAVRIDVRLICANHMPLEEMVQSGRFLKDLLYFVNTAEIRIPALRERPEDIPLLAEHFLAMYTRKYRQPLRELSPEARIRLQHYGWPGNIRELQHVIERAVVMGEGKRVEAADIQVDERPADHRLRDNLNLQDLERTTIRQAIEKNQGNLSRAARDLGLGRTTLYRKLEKYGI